MKKRSFFAYLLCLSTVLSCLSFSSCSKKATKYSAHSFEYFDTVTTVTGYANSREEFDSVCADIFSMLMEYHRLFTVYERYDGLENLCTLNEIENGAHRTVKVDRKIIDLLLYAKEAYEKTDGAVNIAMGSVLSIWHEYREKGSLNPQNASLPPKEALQEAALHTDIDLIRIDEKNATVTLEDPSMRLDVGAIAKGYAVEMIALELEKQNISGYVLNVGGNVRTIGTKADGSEWLVGIENPAENTDEPYTEYISLAGESVVTSGSYQRYYVVDGKNYHHIIDPKTLLPSEYYLSVSVICQSSAEGDALSTALFCMPFEAGLSLVEELKGAEAMWIFPDGTKKYSTGFSSFTVQK